MKALLLHRHGAAVAVCALAGLAAALPAWAAEGEDPDAAGQTQLSDQATFDSGGTPADDPDAASPEQESGSPEDEAAPDDGETESRTAAGSGTTAGRRKERRRLGDRTLREGMKGSDVRHLQKILTELNFDTRVSGAYRKTTKRNARRYERWKEKKVNGVVHARQAQRMKQLMRNGAQYRKHAFPVRGPHDYGGSGSRFGAPRGGRSHQGQDVAAAEGTRLVAAHEGRVVYRQYQAGGAGHYVVIHGKDGSDSVYMHLMEPARLGPGRRVVAGQTIGKVGNTGSSTGPHLHFELWTRHWYDGGSPYDPLQKLKRWDRRN